LTKSGLIPVHAGLFYNNWALKTHTQNMLIACSEQI